MGVNMKGKILQEMLTYFGTDARRINHALKVLGFAKAIALGENLNNEQLEIIELTAILHDIGIPNSEIKYGSPHGRYQEIEGPPVAQELLKKHNVPTHIIERVCFLIGNHHTYKNIDDIDFQIIIEADFFVNAFEDSLSEKAITHMRDQWFKTETGIRLLSQMYL